MTDGTERHVAQVDRGIAGRGQEGVTQEAQA
jgi:hypothetical protein